MEAPSATAASASPPSPKVTLSLGPAAPTHRKARILTRDPLSEAGGSMELQAEDDVRRWVRGQQPSACRALPAAWTSTPSLSVPPQVAETRRAEFSPAQFAGPKKISLNHLLNFTFEPRGAGAGLLDGGPSGWGRRNKWGHKHKPFNKELFLQAKYAARRPPVQSRPDPPRRARTQKQFCCIISLCVLVTAASLW